MAKKISRILVDKALGALISSIEIYNKPDFKYREESFCVLVINAWELLLKAKIINDRKGGDKALYIKEYITKKNGEKSSKAWKYKLTRTGNLQTIGIVKCISKLKESNVISDPTASNIRTLLEFRDNAIHFYNPSLALAKDLHEVGSASIISFINLLGEWFNVTMNQYNLYLLPLSFFISDSYKTVTSIKEEKALIEFIEKEKVKYPFDKRTKNNYAVYISIGYGGKSKNGAGVYLTNDPNSPAVHLSNDELADRYPFSYEKLVNKCKERYSDFKVSQEFHDFKKQYFDNPKYCCQYFPTLNRSGIPRIYYSSAFLEELDKKYTKE